MITWSNASTNEYWNQSSGWVYAGSGVWEGPGGPGATLYEYSATPLAGNPYTYTDAATVYKIKFNLSMTASSFDREVTVRIYTNKGNTYPEDYGDNPYTFEVGVNTVKEIRIDYIPDGMERPTQIIIDGEWGTYYGSNPLLYDIKVDLIGGADDPCCTLYKTTGRRMVTIVDPVGYSPNIVMPFDPTIPYPSTGKPPTWRPLPTTSLPTPTSSAISPISPIPCRACPISSGSLVIGKGCCAIIILA
jgi:hypothetical protein